MKLLNAFSFNMLAGFPATVEVKELSLEEARRLVQAGFESAVGHPDTAAVFSDQLGVQVAANRVSVTLSEGEEALVGQYRGPRLPEGATTLPPGATIKWLRVRVR